MFDDAKLWVNVGEEQIKTYADVQSQLKQLVDYQAVVWDKYDYEIYLYEKPFFNAPYLFIALVMEHKTDVVFEYIRKDGNYWDNLEKKYKGSKDLKAINSEIVFNPPLIVEYSNGTIAKKTVFPIPLYGHHHMNRSSFNLNGGACPGKGGDWASYPWGDAGAGWPVNYQEITPLCDGLAIDVKFWANLFVDTWADPKLAMGNAGFGDTKVIHYKMDGNVYGEFTDPYLKNLKKENPHKLVLTPDGKIAQASDGHKKVVISLEYATESHLNDFYAAPQVGLTKNPNLLQYCPKNCPKAEQCDADKLEEKTCPKPKPAPTHVPEPCNDVGPPNPKPDTSTDDALKATYDIAKKVIGLALFLA